MRRRTFVVLALVWAVLFSGLFGFSARSGSKVSKVDDIWLVTSREPALLSKLSHYAKPYYEEGRVSIVRLETDFGKLPKELKAILQAVKMEEVRSYEPKGKLKLAPDPKIEEVLKKVNATSYTHWLTTLVQFENRDTNDLDEKKGSGNQLAVSWVQDEFSKLGYPTWKYCYSQHQYADECNVMAEKRGETLPDEIIIIEGHLDDVGKYQAGADDNGSGSMALLEMARVLADYSSERTIRFMATNGEEKGLLGAKAYVKLLKNAGILNQIKYVINMDMIGYNKNGKVDIETNSTYEDEAKWYSEQARTYTALTPNISMPAWGSDHVPFLNSGVLAIMTIEYWGTHTPCYHASCDRVDTINFDYALEIIRLNLAVAIQKAGINL